jgi:hypothetical protein
MPTPTFLLLMPDGMILAGLLVAQAEEDCWTGTLHPWNLTPELRAGIPWYEPATRDSTPRMAAEADAALARLNLRAYCRQTHKLYALRSLQLRGRRVRFRLGGPGADPEGNVAAWSITQAETVEV